MTERQIRGLINGTIGVLCCAIALGVASYSMWGLSGLSIGLCIGGFCLLGAAQRQLGRGFQS